MANMFLIHDYETCKSMTINLVDYNSNSLLFKGNTLRISALASFRTFESLKKDNDGVKNQLELEHSFWLMYALKSLHDAAEIYGKE